MLKMSTAMPITLCGLQHFSLFNGPGLRTTVFFKGCPLRCAWCSNPESLEQQLSIAYDKHLCIGIENCGKCRTVCPSGAIYAISDDTIGLARDVCSQCRECVKVCPSKAFQLNGEVLEVEDIVEKIRVDSLYFGERGGVTLSGGEPFMRPKSVLALLALCKDEQWHVAVETCGFFDLDDSHVRKALRHVDVLYYDIKHMDSAKHKLGTGLGNSRILQNLIHLSQEFPQLNIVIRTAIIPEFNATLAEFSAIAQFVKTLPTVVALELLPCNLTCVEKYIQLGLPIPSAFLSKLDKNLLEQCVKVCENIALPVQVLG